MKRICTVALNNLDGIAASMWIRSGHVTQHDVHVTSKFIENNKDLPRMVLDACRLDGPMPFDEVYLLGLNLESASEQMYTSQERATYMKHYIPAALRDFAREHRLVIMENKERGIRTASSWGAILHYGEEFCREVSPAGLKVSISELACQLRLRLHPENAVDALCYQDIAHFLGDVGANRNHGNYAWTLETAFQLMRDPYTSMVDLFLATEFIKDDVRTGSLTDTDIMHALLRSQSGMYMQQVAVQLEEARKMASDSAKTEDGYTGAYVPFAELLLGPALSRFHKMPVVLRNAPKSWQTSKAVVFLPEDFDKDRMKAIATYFGGIVQGDHLVVDFEGIYSYNDLLVHLRAKK